MATTEPMLALPSAERTAPRNLFNLGVLLGGIGGLMVTAGLVAAYINLGHFTKPWPPRGVELSNYDGTMLAVTMLMSAATIEWGIAAARKEFRSQALAGFGLTIGLALAFLNLLWFFGRTLVPGREAFITRLARHARGGALPPGMESYTRRLTFAWCVFFAAQLAISALLLRFGSLESWSLFINVLNFPLLALMFAVDYLYRVLRFGDSPASLTSAVRAYAKDRASSLLTR